MREKLDRTKIWVGDDADLSVAVQKYGIARGWSWGKNFGGSGIQKDITFITFIIYDGEKRMFCGVNGQTTREAFHSKPFSLLTPSDIGYHQALKKQTAQVERGTKVKLLEMKGFPDETIYMAIRLSVGEIYTVKEYKEHYGNNPSQESAIQLVEGNAWYPLSAFSIVPIGTTPEYINQLLWDPK